MQRQISQRRIKRMLQGFQSGPQLANGQRTEAKPPLISEHSTKAIVSESYYVQAPDFNAQAPRRRFHSYHGNLLLPREREAKVVQREVAVATRVAGRATRRFSCQLDSWGGETALERKTRQVLIDFVPPGTRQKRARALFHHCVQRVKELNMLFKMIMFRQSLKLSVQAAEDIQQQQQQQQQQTMGLQRAKKVGLISIAQLSQKEMIAEDLRKTAHRQQIKVDFLVELYNLKQNDQDNQPSAKPQNAAPESEATQPATDQRSELMTSYQNISSNLKENQDGQEVQVEPQEQRQRKSFFHIIKGMLSHHQELEVQKKSDMQKLLAEQRKKKLLELRKRQIYNKQFASQHCSEAVKQYVQRVDTLSVPQSGFNQPLLQMPPIFEERVPRIQQIQLMYYQQEDEEEKKRKNSSSSSNQSNAQIQLTTTTTTSTHKVAFQSAVRQRNASQKLEKVLKLRTLDALVSQPGSFNNFPQFSDFEPNERSHHSKLPFEYYPQTHIEPLRDIAGQPFARMVHKRLGKMMNSANSLQYEAQKQKRQTIGNTFSVMSNKANYSTQRTFASNTTVHNNNESKMATVNAQISNPAKILLRMQTEPIDQHSQRSAASSAQMRQIHVHTSPTAAFSLASPQADSLRKNLQKQNFQSNSGENFTSASTSSRRNLLLLLNKGSAHLSSTRSAASISRKNFPHIK